MKPPRAADITRLFTLEESRVCSYERYPDMHVVVQMLLHDPDSPPLLLYCLDYTLYTRLDASTNQQMDGKNDRERNETPDIPIRNENVIDH